MYIYLYICACLNIHMKVNVYICLQGRKKVTKSYTQFHSELRKHCESFFKAILQ